MKAGEPGVFHLEAGFLYDPRNKSRPRAESESGDFPTHISTADA
jgi:hypothetical protein